MKLIFVALAMVSMMLVLTSRTGKSLPQSKHGKSREIASARDLIRQSLEATGGEANLRALKSSRLEIIGQRNFLEVPERPEGPFPTIYEQFSELREFVSGSLRRTQQQRWSQVPKWSPLSTLVTAHGFAAIERDKKWQPARAAQLRDAEDWLDIAPERVLLNALEAGDLRLAGSRFALGANNLVVAFSRKGKQFELLLNESTHFPTAIELTAPHPADLFWNPWGDVTDRVFYTQWELEPNNVRYPRQWTIERNGLPHKTFTITELELNPAVPTEAFHIPEETRAAFTRNLILPDELSLNWLARESIKELVPGVVKISSGFDTALIRQPDGVIVVEAPTSNGYSVKVIAEAHRRFPGVPIKALIATDYYVAHQAGIREYVAHGLPIYTLSINAPFLQQIIAAPHRSRPDTLARFPRRAKLELISNKTKIGKGTNRIELYPIQTVSGERMMMIYFPEHRLLYGSDLFQRDGNGKFYSSQTVSELIEAVNRERLSVDKVFMAHVGLTAWKEITAISDPKPLIGK